MAEDGMDQEALNETDDGKEDILLPQKLRSNDLKMDPANFEVSENAEEQHVAGFEEYRAREEESMTENTLRKLQDYQSGNNYVNVKYSPYEWLREVRTEYYFRCVFLVGTVFALDFAWLHGWTHGLFPDVYLEQI
jgi:hypothetical protein